MKRAYCSPCRRWYSWVKHPIRVCPGCGVRLEER